MKTRKIMINVNYGWPQGNRSGIIEVPEEEMDDVEEYVYDWIMNDITWSWEDITNCEEE